MWLQYGFVNFWQKDFGAKAANKMLVKLTHCTEPSPSIRLPCRESRRQSQDCIFSPGIGFFNDSQRRRRCNETNTSSFDEQFTRHILWVRFDGENQSSQNLCANVVMWDWCQTTYFITSRFS